MRSVNHRFFNPSIKLPSELSKWEGDVREALRRGVARGHVTLIARVERASRTRARIDEERFGAYVEQIRALQERFGLLGDARCRDRAAPAERHRSRATVKARERPRSSSRSSTALLPRSIRCERPKVRGSRTTSRSDLRSSSRRSTGSPSARRQRLVEQRDRLRAAVSELADGVAVDEQRLAQEIAMLADRLDVAEEISRFHSHFAAFRATLALAVSRTASASGSASCSRSCCARRTRPAARRTTPRSLQDVHRDQGGARADPRAGGEPRSESVSRSSSRRRPAAERRPSPGSLLERRRDVGYSVSCTTRAPRPGEVDGKDYYFLTRDEFIRRRRGGRVRRVGGGARQPVRHAAERDRAGARRRASTSSWTSTSRARGRSATAFPTSVTVFVLPPSGEVLLERLRSAENGVPATARRRGYIPRCRSCGRSRSTSTSSSTTISTTRCSASERSSTPKS